MFVYVIVNSATLKIYIGQHRGKNLQKYLQTKISDAVHGRGGSSHLFASMRKYPKDAWSIHSLMHHSTRDDLDYWERHFIRVLKTQHPDVGYNIQQGGEGASPNNKYALGCKHSPEAIRRTLGGKNFSAEWRQHQSEAHQGQRGTWLGRKFSKTHLANLRKAHLGQQAWNKGLPCSEDARRKNSEAHKGRVPWNKGLRSISI